LAEVKDTIKRRLSPKKNGQWRLGFDMSGYFPVVKVFPSF
jgi:hypothetical protein